MMLNMLNSPVTASSIVDCCLGYIKGRVPMKHIAGYVEQNSNEMCDIDAIILQTFGGLQYCTNPKRTWVKIVLRRLSKRLKEMSNQS
ncbi:C-C motif chemokine 20-like [Callorhinchus milii]|nr:C-C motif chemokine 20-like [Callorhinchus milii]|eukprot:gi/632934572/ref/XP_007885552.1/ PREDICTED: C-C motif chemokine 20-like [Callorhinchus milii]